MSLNLIDTAIINGAMFLHSCAKVPPRALQPKDGPWRTIAAYADKASPAAAAKAALALAMESKGDVQREMIVTFIKSNQRLENENLPEAISLLETAADSNQPEIRKAAIGDFLYLARVKNSQFEVLPALAEFIATRYKDVGHPSNELQTMHLALREVATASIHRAALSESDEAYRLPLTTVVVETVERLRPHPEFEKDIETLRQQPDYRTICNRLKMADRQFVPA